MAPRPEDRVPLKLVKVKRHKPLLPGFAQRFKFPTMETLRTPETWPPVLQFCFYPQGLGMQQSFVFRMLVWFAMAGFTVSMFVSGSDAWIVEFLHSLNLLVHEAGHPIFGFFGGHMIMSLGGSLFQCLMPLVFCLALWLKPRDLFGAAIALWWSFENVVDCVPYIADALPMKLMLTSGGTGSEMEYGFHDWNYILSEWGLLVKCDVIAARVNVVGLVGATLCVLWGAWSLWYYWAVQRKNFQI